ncbi:protein phosphatase 2C domain-containing protein [Streptomyces sp. NPDC096033]|uniref:protein phosphatase 2C domain-containing protein n=1 Tax=Streptomyces sp. NPDC096033 TaxID=3366071 RepID=UPI0037FE437B
MSMHRLSGCPSCAEPLEEGDRFCGVCGYALSAPPAPPDRTPTLPDPAPGGDLGAGPAVGGTPAWAGAAAAPARPGPGAGVTARAASRSGAPQGPGAPDAAPSAGVGAAYATAGLSAEDRAAVGAPGDAYADGSTARTAGPATTRPGSALPGAAARETGAGRLGAGDPAPGSGSGGPAAYPAHVPAPPHGEAEAVRSAPGFGSGVPAPGWEGTPVTPGSAIAPDTAPSGDAPWGAAPYGGADDAHHGRPLGAAPEEPYGATPQGTPPGSPYGTPRGDRGEGSYAAPQEGTHEASFGTSRRDGHEAAYGSPRGDRPEDSYGAPQEGPYEGSFGTAQGDRQEVPYGTRQGDGHDAAYGSPPGDRPESSYGPPQENPYEGPFGAAQGDRQEVPYGAVAEPDPHEGPYTAPQADGYAGAAQADPHEGPYTGTPQGSGGGRTCVACRTGYVDTDGYCEHCGHAQPRERDHLEEELCSVAAVSDRGLRHHRNEDSFAVAATAMPDGSAATVAIVCDGVSSASRPDDASAAAAGAASEALLDALPRGAHPVEAMHEAILAAGAAVSALAPQPPGAQNAPACTLVGAVVSSGVLTIGWVGDSRAYWVPDDRAAVPRRLTEDDSWAAQMVAAGLMGEAEAYADVRAHAITGWLGADAYDLDPHTASFRPDHPGVVVVCTDGLWNYAESAADMAQILPADAAERPLHCAQVLVGHALDGGGHDNITVAVVPFTAVPPEPGAEAGTAGVAEAEAEAEAVAHAEPPRPLD